MVPKICSHKIRTSACPNFKMHVKSRCTQQFVPADHLRLDNPIQMFIQGINGLSLSVSTDVWPQPSEQEVKNLKVCIELTGLRLSKPRNLHNLHELWDRQGQLNHDRPQFGAPNLGLPPTSKSSLPQLQTAKREKLDPCPSEIPRVAHGVPAVDRKVKANGFEDKGVKKKAEVERGWTKEQLEFAGSDTGTSSYSKRRAFWVEQRSLLMKNIVSRGPWT